MVLADLPTSNGANVAEEMGDNATFVPTDVSSAKTLIRGVGSL